MNYEWDPLKAAANLKKHRVRFEEAASVFLDPLGSPSPIPITLMQKNVRLRLVIPRVSG